MTLLEEFDEKHLASTFIWLQDTSLKNNFLFQKDVTEESHHKWFLAYSKDSTQQIFAIIFGGKHVGNIGIKNINSIHQIAESWIYIGEKSFKGKGIAKEAYFQLFEAHKISLRKIYCHIADFNISSIKLHQRVGFKVEGIFQDEVLLNKQFHTLIRLSVFL